VFIKLSVEGSFDAFYEEVKQRPLYVVKARTGFDGASAVSGGRSLIARP
jgi:hypothetical protein